MSDLIQNYIRGDSAVNIAGSVERAVGEGKLRPGDALPTVRALAARLEVSPGTVAAAYRLLRSRGVVSGERRRGTRVRQRPPLAVSRPPMLSRRGIDLASGNPDPALLPSLASVLPRLTATPRLYGEDKRDERLCARAVEAFVADGVPAHAVAVVGGALDGIERVLREHLRAGDRVAVEDPCFTGVSDLLASLSLVPIPFAVDDDGPLAESVEQALRSRPAALVVTPRAQNPFGSAVSERRGRELRRLLRRHPELLLIEDDHAGPVAGSPYVTLLSGQGHWAVVRSVSKWLGPDLRVAFVAGDAVTLARLEGRQQLGVRWVSQILQESVRLLWSSRNTMQLVARAERTYRERREALVEALDAAGVAAHGRSGLNVWVPVDDETAAVQALQAKGWDVAAGHRYRLSSPPAIRVTIARLSPRDAIRFAADVAAAVAGSGVTRV